MNYNLNFFLEKISNNKVGYRNFLQNKNNVINQDSVDLSIIIGTKNRDKYLIKCLDYLNYSISQTKIKASIIVVQHDIAPTHRLISLEKKASYIFIPLDETNTDNQYSRSLAYNVGYFANPNATSLLFHDIDVLFPHDYFSTFEKHYLNNNLKWLQNFNGKSLYCLNKDQTKKVFEVNGILNLYSIQNVVKGGPGAAGGSVTCKTDLFKQVGGYDPEIFWGWAPEDSMFWTKLLCTVLEAGPMRNCHQFENKINYVYADNPPLRLFHLFHDPVPNTKWGEMQAIHDAFWSLPYTEKQEYIKLKSSLFKL
jgi:hypothetical protein